MIDRHFNSSQFMRFMSYTEFLKADDGFQKCFGAFKAEDSFFSDLDTIRDAAGQTWRRRLFRD